MQLIYYVVHSVTRTCLRYLVVGACQPVRLHGKGQADANSSKRFLQISLCAVICVLSKCHEALNWSWGCLSKSWLVSLLHFKIQWTTWNRHGYAEESQMNFPQTWNISTNNLHSEIGSVKQVPVSTNLWCSLVIHVFVLVSFYMFLCRAWVPHQSYANMW